MARAVSPSGGGGGDAAAWVIPGAAAAGLVVGGALWVGGGLASLLSGAGWHSAPFGLSLLIGVVTDGTGASSSVVTRTRMRWFRVIDSR